MSYLVLGGPPDGGPPDGGRPGGPPGGPVIVESGNQMEHKRHTEMSQRQSNTFGTKSGHINLQMLNDSRFVI